MDIVSYVTDTIESDYADLKQQIEELRTELYKQENDIARIDHIVGRDSVDLTALLFEKVYDGVIETAGGGGTDVSDPFDISQKSVDSKGNTVIPHSLYIVSAYTPALPSPGARQVVFNGTLISAGDISVAISRTTEASPARWESRVEVYNALAPCNVHVQVRRLLGTR